MVRDGGRARLRHPGRPRGRLTTARRRARRHATPPWSRRRRGPRCGSNAEPDSRIPGASGRQSACSRASASQAPSASDWLRPTNCARIHRDALHLGGLDPAQAAGRARARPSAPWSAAGARRRPWRGRRRAGRPSRCRRWCRRRHSRPRSAPTSATSRGRAPRAPRRRSRPSRRWPSTVPPAVGRRPRHGRPARSRPAGAGALRAAWRRRARRSPRRSPRRCSALLRAIEPSPFARGIGRPRAERRRRARRRRDDGAATACRRAARDGRRRRCAAAPAATTRAVGRHLGEAEVHQPRRPRHCAAPVDLPPISATITRLLPRCAEETRLKPAALV